MTEDDKYRKIIDDIKDDLDSICNKKTISQNIYYYHKRYKDVYLYVCIPIVIFILLNVIKPKCVTYVTIDKNGDDKIKVDIKKFISWTVLLTIICMFGLYMYKKKEIKKEI